MISGSLKNPLRKYTVNEAKNGHFFFKVVVFLVEVIFYLQGYFLKITSNDF